MIKKTSNRIVQAYLFFDGRCEEALDFYRKAVGAQVDAVIKIKDSPDPAARGSALPDKVMHASFRIGETTVMASDGQCGGKPSFEGFALSITTPTEADADRLFAALADSGQVQMPLAKTFFSPKFGMVTDRFGVAWMVFVAP